MLSAIMKAEKQSQGARVLKGDEKFGNDDYEEKKEEVIMQKYPPGYIPPPEPKKKKKRIRKKKDKENPNDEADGNYKDDENGD